jgi:hypothetical protein
MLVSANAQGMKLIESGFFHVSQEVAASSGLELLYKGIKVIVKTKIVDKNTKSNLSVSVNGGDVVFEHITDTPPFGAPVGLIIPTEIGILESGVKIYFAWFSHVIQSQNGAGTVITSYSFYEDGL